MLTQILVEFSRVLELDVEVPASTEGTHGRLFPVALPADHADLGTIGTIRECTGYAKEIKRERGQNPHRRVALQKPPAYLLFRFKFLVRRFYHLVLLRQVNPKLKAARIGLARFVDGHFRMNDCEITLSMRFDYERALLHLRNLLPRPCHRRRLLAWLVRRRDEGRGRDVPRTSIAHHLLE